VGPLRLLQFPFVDELLFTSGAALMPGVERVVEIWFSPSFVSDLSRSLSSMYDW
jgi:hypothetical protein